MDNHSVKQKILIVDDEPDNIRILASSLTGDYKLIGATSGREALECVTAESPPDLILLDIMMPDMSGYEVLSELKTYKKAQDIPVIFITSMDKAADEIRGLELGASDYVIKPFNPSIINARVRNHLERRRMEAQLRESETRYRAVVEDQTELICRFRPDGTLTFVNDAYCRCFDKTQKEMIGQNFLSFIPPEDREKAKNHLTVLTPKNSVATTEHQVMNAAGEIRWHQRTVRAIFNNQDSLIEFQSVGRDTTERRLAEDSLRQAMQEKQASQAKLEAVFRSIPEGIITVDAGGRVIQINTPLKNICALAGHIIPGKQLGKMPDQCPGQCVSVLRRLLDTGQTVSEHNMECPGSGGQKKRLSLTTSPLLDHRNNVIGAMLVIRDITRLVELEIKLQERGSFKNIIGRSEPMQRIYTLLEQFAHTETTVLITGETGTGKERVMEAVHYGSLRSEKPLVRVNCAMLAENILESELFGHVKGAFTGAIRDRAGRFETAQGGTIFLDEIGELAPHLQAKLLRILEYKEFERVGDSKTCKADVRIIAATNVGLAEQVRQGRFREDLYYRLKVFNIHLPPLRDRAGDIPLLMKYFMDIEAKNNGKQFTGISDKVLNIFMRHSWPGNVRELKNTIEYACVLCPGGTITAGHLPPELLADAEKSVTVAEQKQPVRNSEKESILEALNRTKWNKTKAARLLDVSRGTFYSRLRKYGIDTNK
ncbi:sigma 54-interacting transcriptional regulator [Desulfonema magnum]|uniref:Diguanylate cyclase n=1 Tax=Desulfonema magnum TaxID=45655 RepID=A0A975GNB1_9BACT|nr:sigma 54-interacting transcriptional regulator [Desulfonema magnum]QTA87776.1 Putative diguanylate cyclase [Desulfonema magnum]